MARCRKTVIIMMQVLVQSALALKTQDVDCGKQTLWPNMVPPPPLTAP